LNVSQNLPKAEAKEPQVFEEPSQNALHSDIPNQFENNVFEKVPEKEESFDDHDSPIGQTFHEHMEQDMLFNHEEPESS